MSRNRIGTPETIHATFVASEYDAAMSADLRRQADETLRYQDRRKRPVLAGTWTNGEAGSELARLLDGMGIIENAARTGTVPEVHGDGAEPTFTLLAGTGSLSNCQGTDLAGILAVTPSDTNVTGSFLQLSFAVTQPTNRYAVLLFPRTTAAQLASGNLNTTSHTVDSFDLRTSTALTNGSDYRWSYVCLPF